MVWVQPAPRPGLVQSLLQTVLKAVLLMQKVVPPVPALLRFPVVAVSAPAVALQSEAAVLPVMVESAPAVASVMAAVLPVVVLQVIAEQREPVPEAAVPVRMVRKCFVATGVAQTADRATLPLSVEQRAGQLLLQLTYLV